jgi:hypothetical protein
LNFNIPEHSDQMSNPDFPSGMSFSQDEADDFLSRVDDVN